MFRQMVELPPSDNGPAPIVRAAGKRVAAAAAALCQRWEEFENALFNAPGSTWDDAGVDPELLEAARIFAGAPTTAERLRRHSIHETTRGAPGPRG